MKYLKIFCTWCFVVLANLALAQFKDTVLFKGDSGYLLVQKLYSQFKPFTVLDYSNARVKMYTEIYNVKDTVHCVYTRHALYLDPSSSDPIGYLIKNGNPNGINCEHTFPQSKGAEFGNAKSDMHHLFPSIAKANEARSNYPFGEINDNSTDEWYYKSIVMQSKPTKEINEYSESISNMFEPREDHKGNAARAIFYFITMYELQSDKAFFENMRPTLCQWHIYDPVDSTEWTRSQIIGKYQNNLANPFVLDCSLARRCYCPNISDCVPTVDTKEFETTNIKIYPNPFSSTFNIELNSPSSNTNIEIYNNLGQKVYTKKLPDGILTISIDNFSDSPGLYHLVMNQNNKIIYRGMVNSSGNQ